MNQTKKDERRKWREGFMEKVTVESGVEQRWGDKDEMTVTGTHHRQVGEVL